ncbi:MAG: polyprenol monophosphomannose synthase [Candidatus Peregrinibacteria bacterium]
MKIMLPIPSTLVIIPTFNERENIAPLCERLFALYPTVHILVVDDGSPDGTAHAVEEAQCRFPSALHLLRRSGKGGRGSAVLAGFVFALAREYRLIFEMDADFSHRPEDMERFFEAIRDCDVVSGSRYLPGSQIRDWPRRRTILSRWANRFARLVLQLPMTDFTNGFRCYRREALLKLNLRAIHAKGYVVLSEIADRLHLAGQRICEVPTIFVNRKRGISNLSLNEITSAFTSVLRIRFTRSAYRAALPSP